MLPFRAHTRGHSSGNAWPTRAMKSQHVLQALSTAGDVAVDERDPHA